MNLKISTMSGKMKGIGALNTNTLTNEFCLKMLKNSKNICSKCYSHRLLKTYRANCSIAWEKNSKLLSTKLLDKSGLPVITSKLFRFSAHGELINDIMYKNFISIAKLNKDVKFSLFTKRKDIIKKIGKPDTKNIILVYSEPLINKINPVVPKYFDKVFTAYTKDFAMEHNIKINCGSKNCLECKKCYTKNNTTHINELIK